MVGRGQRQSGKSPGRSTATRRAGALAPAILVSAVLAVSAALAGAITPLAAAQLPTKAQLPTVEKARVAPILPSGGVPGGFDRVVTTVAVTASGKVVSGVAGGVTGRLSIPPGAVSGTEDVVITSANLAGITPARVKVAGRLRRDHPLYAIGILFERGTRRVAERKAATVTLLAREFSRSDYVVVYYAARHAFVPAHRGTARAGAGQVVVRLKTGSEVVVLAP